MNKKDRDIIINHKQFVVHFAELGSYEDFEKWFDTEEKADDQLRKWQKDMPLHYGWTAKVIRVARNSEKP